MIAVTKSGVRFRHSQKRIPKWPRCLHVRSRVPRWFDDDVSQTCLRLRPHISPHGSPTGIFQLNLNVFWCLEMWGRIVPELPLELYSSRGNQVRLKCNFRMVPLSECSVCVPIYIYIYIYTAPWWQFVEYMIYQEQETDWAAGPPMTMWIYMRDLILAPSPSFWPPRPWGLLGTV